MSSVTSLWPEDSIFHAGGLSLGLTGDAGGISSYTFVDMLWYAILGGLGGVLGAGYNAGVISLIKLRSRWLPPIDTEDGFNRRSVRGIRARGRALLQEGGRKWGRGARARMTEAALLSLLVFSAFYWVPFALPCSPCQPHMSCYVANASVANASAGHARALAATPSADGTVPVVHRVHLVYLRYGCRAGEYSQSASLLHTGQEGLVMHLLERTGSYEVPLTELGVIMVLYIFLAILVFGISVPGGNFIPGMTMGAMIGRCMGEVGSPPSDPRDASPVDTPS